MKKGNNAFTITETYMAAMILGIIVLGFAVIIRVMSKSAVQGEALASSTQAGQQLFAHLEADLYLATEVTYAKRSHIAFICDANRAPGFNPTGDMDGDGIINEEDPDMDGDAADLSIGGWARGFNLTDDDDLQTSTTHYNDGNIDYRVKFFKSGKKVYRDYSVNGEEWGSHRRVIGEGVKKLTFHYFGNASNALGHLLDLGHDGKATPTPDTGEGDGVIDEVEIDTVTWANGGQGNANGELDAKEERRYITSIRIYAEFDSNGDGVVDYDLESEIFPPLLPAKALRAFGW